MSTQALTFVRDPEHRWNPKEPPTRWEMLASLVNASIVHQTSRMAVHGGWVYKASSSPAAGP